VFISSRARKAAAVLDLVDLLDRRRVRKQCARIALHLRKPLDDLDAVLAHLLDQSVRKVRQGTSALVGKSTGLSRVVSSLALTVLSVALTA
jgi:hypothetical protein